MLLQPFGLDLYIIPDETVCFTSSNPRNDTIGLLTIVWEASFVLSLYTLPFGFQESGSRYLLYKENLTRA